MRTKDVIATRQSCRAYKEEQITSLDKSILLQAANAAPIARGEIEKVRIIVVQNPEILKKIDKKGAEYFGDLKLNPLYGAPTLFLIAGLGKDEKDRNLTFCNAACIIENMLLAATDIRLGSVFLMGPVAAIRDDQELKEALHIPEDFIIAAGMAVGKPVEPPIMRTLTPERIAVETI